MEVLSNAGYQIGVMNSLYEFYRVKYNWGSDSAYIWKWVTSITMMVACLVSIFGSCLLNILGRRGMMHVGNIFTCIASIIIQINGTAYLLIGRGLYGVAMGFYFYVAAGYLRECSPPKDSGKYITFHQLNIVVAILIGAAFSLAIPNKEDIGKIEKDSFYRIVMAFPVVISLLQTILLVFVIKYDSPKCEYMANREKISRDILARMYKSQQVIDDTIALYQKEAEVEKRVSSSNSVFWSMYLKLLLVGCFIAVCQQLSGVNSIMMYSTPMFYAMTGKEQSAKLGTVVIDIAQLLFTLLSFALVDRVGRKVLFIIGCIGCGITQVLFGILYDEDKIENSADYAELVILVVFIAFFSISLGPVTYKFYVDGLTLEKRCMQSR
jgi:MFS family permease